MPKNSNNEIHRIQKDISNLLHEGKSSDEIMQLLKIPLRSYRRYTSTINKQNQKAWYSLVKGELATELLHLRASIEESYQAALKLSKIPGLDTQDILATLRAKDGMRLDIINLLYEGTELLTEEENQQQTKYHKSQSKIMQQLQPHP